MFTNQLYIFIVSLILMISMKVDLRVDRMKYGFGFMQMNSVMKSLAN